MIYPAQTDRRTRVAVKASYLNTALAALRRAITLADSDEERDTLTNATASVAQAEREAERDFATIRYQEASIASAALEA